MSSSLDLYIRMQSFVKYDMISHLQLTLAINTSHLQLIHDIPLLWKACFQEVCLGGIIEGAIDSQGFTIHTFFKSFLGAELADASHLPAPDNTFFVGGPKVVVLASPGPCAYLRDRCMRILSSQQDLSGLTSGNLARYTANSLSSSRYQNLLEVNAPDGLLPIARVERYIKQYVKKARTLLISCPKRIARATRDFTHAPAASCIPLPWQLA